MPEDIIVKLKKSEDSIGDDGDSCELIHEKALKQYAFEREWKKENGHLYKVVHADEGTVYKRPEPNAVKPQIIPEDWSLDKHFRDTHGQDIFDELTFKHKGQRINFKYTNSDKGIDIDIDGTIIELYAPANKSVKLTKDNYRVLWDNGKTGIVELEDKDVDLLG